LVRKVIILLLLFYFQNGIAQTEDEAFNQLMEKYAEYTASSVDFLDLYDQVASYKRNPININEASFAELSAFTLIGRTRAHLIIEHRKNYGALISIYELQCIPTFTTDYIQLILQYVSIKEQRVGKLSQLLKEGRHDLIILGQYTDISHLQPVNPTDSSRILGDGMRTLLRHKYGMPGKYSFGITAEKDAGELWPVSENGLKSGFLSAHAFIQPKGKIVHSLALGDFQVNFGQGLTFSSGLSFGKSSLVLKSFRAREGIRAYRSVNENQFLRGAAARINLSKKANITGFVSRNYENVVIGDDGQAGSLNNFGYVRTLRDLSRKDNQQIDIIGGHYSQQINSWSIGFTGAVQQFSVPFRKRSEPYAVHRFSGNQLLNIGFDYKGNVKNGMFYGEISGNDFQKNPAMTHGALIALNKRWSANIHYRSFPKDYHSIFSTAWGEQTTPTNEQAIYLALQYEIYRKWKLSVFADVVSFPWLRFRDDATGYQQDYFAEVKQDFTKYSHHYLRARSTLFSDNCTTESKTKQQQLNQRWNFRYHFDRDKPGHMATAFRAEVVHLKNKEKNVLGILVFADLGYKSKKGKWKIVGRYTVFNTPDFDSRIYAYENDVLYAFSIPAMYGQGFRTYLVLTAKPFRRFTVWAKITVEKNERKSTLDQLNFRPLGRVQIRYTW